MRENRWLCGWRVASDVPLPDLLPWTGDERKPDVEILLGDVPECLPDAVHSGPLLQVGADGSCRFAIPRVASYLIEGGRRVTLSPGVDVAAAEIRVFLLGTVFGILCHQRGLLPLHASCVRIGGSAVAFSGPSGIGKSTLAAAFACRGHAILADDVTVVDVSASGRPVVLPAFPRLKLWRDAMDSLSLSTEGLEQSRADLEKFHLRTESSFTADPLPLAAVYHLRDARDLRHEGQELLRGIQAVRDTNDNVYRGRLAQRLPGKQGLLDRVARLCASTRLVRFSRQRDIGRLSTAVDSIAAVYENAA